MEMEGKQRNIRDRRMKMQIEAASAAAAAAEMDNGETDDDVKKKKAVVGGSVDAGEMGSSGSKRRLSPVGSSGSPAARCCQAENCAADLKVSKQYHRRHRVCEYHAKAAAVTVGGVRQRFCQQCSRFHELLEFDETKRSCRRRLAGHNERRRKSSSGESNSDGSGGQVSRLGCGEVDDSGKIHIAIPQDNAANHKHFNI